MTKEEALKVIRHMAYLSAHVVENGVEAYECIEQLFSQPSLPSNLDEAAEEYLKQYNESEFGNGGDDWDDDIIITFKAGAKWMAGQGVTKEAVIGMATEEISINVSEQTFNELDLCSGDKVVVQIRKK